MRKVSLAIGTCAMLLWTGVALATPTAQEQCDSARITAWAKYVSCVDAVVAKDAKGVYSGWSVESAAFGKCRHAYFKNWTAFQSKASLATSTCALGSANRFSDNGTTETDNLTALVWEKKTTDGSVQDKGNWYTWSTGLNNEDGTAFTTFLTAGLNTPGFAGANGWRLPTLAELQTIVLDFPCTGEFRGARCQCGSNPCVAFDASNTQSSLYWSATSYVPDPNRAWGVSFISGIVDDSNYKTLSYYVRAVRGGL